MSRKDGDNVFLQFLNENPGSVVGIILVILGVCASAFVGGDVGAWIIGVGLFIVVMGSDW